MAWKPLSAAGVSSAGKKRGCYILKQLCEAWGCQPVNAVGSVGCFYCESQCDPAQYNKAEKAGTFKGSAANGTGYGAGIAQWSLSWKADIQRMFRRYTPIESWTLDQQIEIVKQTCKPTFINQLKNCQTATASTDIWLRGYENGGGGSGSLCSKSFIDNYKWCNGYYGAMQHRSTAAIEILKAYQGGEVGADVAGNISTYVGAGEIPENFSGSVVETGYESVIENSSENIYSAIQFTEKQPEKRTRIFQLNHTKITVDEMSLDIDGQKTTINSDLSTGETAISSIGQNIETNNTDTTTSTSNSTSANITSETASKPEQPGNRASAASSDAILAAGISYPLIRINDHYFSPHEIVSFELATINFVPTVDFRFKIKSQEMLKENIVKDGDILAVFMAPTQAMYKSLRCDFIITECDSPEINVGSIGQEYSFHVYGELYIPDLYNANMTWAFSGSSRDALIYASEQLKLCFYFNDNENTDDAQMWYCTTNMDEEVSRPSNVKEFIQDVASHSWKNFESFYDCWIDPRYGISFININKQLGEDGPDELIDIVPYQSAILSHREQDNKRGSETETELQAAVGRDAVRPQGKIISNVSTDPDSNSPFFAISFKEINRSGEISRIMGVNITAAFTVGNWSSGENEPKQFTMSYSMPYNNWKMQHGFYMLIGPGKNESYIPGDSYTEFVRKNTQKHGGAIADIQADSDSETIIANEDNMLATGSVNKFYDTALEHNRINNLQLQKKYIEVELNGANFAIMRGEKIPALMVDTDKAGQMLNLNQESIVKNLIYENASGWFIIDSIRWVFSPEQPAKYGTNWRTYVRLIRREWPISGRSICPNASEDKSSTGVEIKNDIASGNTIESTTSNIDSTSDITEIKPNQLNGTGNNTSVPTTGLSEPVLAVWNAIKTAFPDTTLVRGRWYPADENQQKYSEGGSPFIVTPAGNYCILDENMEYHEVNTEYIQRFYGNALNIRYNSGSASDLVYKIMDSREVLNVIYKYGASVTWTSWNPIDSSKDTVQVMSAFKSGLRPFWNIVFAKHPEWKQYYSSYYSEADLYNTIQVVKACRTKDGKPKDPAFPLMGIDT